MGRRVAGMVVVVCGLVGVVGAAPPAGAETRLAVEAGYGDDNFVPGEALPVRVRIDSDRLVRGHLELGLHIPGSENPPMRVPIEVSGGSNKQVVTALPTPAGVDRLTVTVSLPALGLDGRAQVGFARDTELVGLLPDAAPQVPRPLTLPAGLGRAIVEELDPATLATPGALDALGTVVTGADGLSPLDDTARANVIGWLADGGRLVTDGAPGDHVDGLPDAWQPASLAARRSPAGRGEVVLADGAVSAGRWNEVVAPTTLLTPGELGVGQDFALGAGGVAQTVAADGGLRVPSLGWLGVFLVAYVVVAGPATFAALRRMRRGNLTWLAVPLVALVFAVGAFVVGTGLRSNAHASHGTVVQTGPGGTQALSYVALVSRSGEDGRAEFPAGWTAASLTNGAGAVAGPVDDPWVDGGGVDVDPAQVSRSADGTVGQVDLDAGGVGMVVGWGTLGDTDGLEVSATAHADGTVTGTVRNTSDVTLHQVMVMVGALAWDGGSLDPGEQAEWRIEFDPDGGAESLWGGRLPERPWEDATGWMDGEPDRDSPVSYDLWNELKARQRDPYPTGLAVAAGWTRDWHPEVDVGRDLDAGRTVFVSEGQVVADDGAAPAAAVRREVLRTGPLDDADRFPNARDWGGTGQMVMRFDLPNGSDGGAAALLAARLPAYVIEAEVWNGSTWVPLSRRAADGRAVPDGDIDVDFDPGDPNRATVADLPAAAVRDGSVLLRVSVVDMGSGLGVWLPSVEARP